MIPDESKESGTKRLKMEGKQTYRFSEAPIWELQLAYYEQQGTRAWSQVPQYITNNPKMATAYAEMIFGFLQDLAAKGEVSEPVTLLELGAGSGRLAYHILKCLCELKEEAGLELPPFRYVLTDFSWNHIKDWQSHPSLQAWVQEGLLDFARFDAVKDTELHLVVSETTIRPGDLKQPLLVIANYFFDGIPQELIYVGDGSIYECDVVLEFPEHYGELPPSEALQSITMTYEYRHEPLYEAEDYPYQELISLYRQELEDSHILLPVAGLRCMERLGRLSVSGFLLITSDKGDHRLDNWRFAEPPQLIHHGSFSLTANYHALWYEFEQRGAFSLFPAQHYRNINVGCIFMLENAKSYAQTRLAYRRFIERFGPDEFFSLKEWVDRNTETMELQQLIAFWRLGGYDAEFFIQNAKRITGLLPEASDEDLLDIQAGIRIMWSSYFELKLGYDLALDAGLVLFEMNLYEDAKYFLDISVEADEEGTVPTVFQCLAICSYELGMEEAAVEYLQKALALEPEHEEALALMACLKEALQD